MIDWLWAFLLTQTVEVPIYTWAMRGRVLVGFGASAITHPIVWFVFPALFGDTWNTVYASEVFAVIVEAIYLRLFRAPRPLLLALAANAASFGVGLLTHALIGMP